MQGSGTLVLTSLIMGVLWLIYRYADGAWNIRVSSQDHITNIKGDRAYACLDIQREGALTGCVGCAGDSLSSTPAAADHRARQSGIDRCDHGCFPEVFVDRGATASQGGYRHCSARCGFNHN